MSNFPRLLTNGAKIKVDIDRSNTLILVKYISCSMRVLMDRPSEVRSRVSVCSRISADRMRWREIALPRVKRVRRRRIILLHHLYIKFLEYR